MRAYKNNNKENERIIQYMRQPLVSFEWAIRHLLCRKANFEAMEGFLFELLRMPVKIVSFLKSENPDEEDLPESAPKYIIAEDEDGEFMIIELTFALEHDYLSSMKYGMSSTLVNHVYRFVNELQIKKIFSILFVYFDVSENTDFLYSGKMGIEDMNEDYTSEIADIQRSILYAIDKGRISSQYYILMRNKFRDIPKSILDEWFIFMKHGEVKEDFIARGLIKARDICDYNRLPFEVRVDYDRAQSRFNRRLSQTASVFELAKREAEQKYESLIWEQDKDYNEYIMIDSEYYRVLAEHEELIEEWDRRIYERDEILTSCNTELARRKGDLKELRSTVEQQIKALEVKNRELLKRLREIREQRLLLYIK
jgi:hypothetical protein